MVCPAPEAFLAGGDAGVPGALRVGLAEMGGVWLIADVTVQLEHRTSGYAAAASSALSFLLGLLLLAATTLSVSHALHQTVHRDGPVNGHFCLVCSFAKGQVSVTEVAAVTAIFIFCWFVAFRLASVPALSGVDHRVSHSRAPPQSSSAF